MDFASPLADTPSCSDEFPMFFLLRFFFGWILRLALIALVCVILVQKAFGTSRIKDITDFEGVRDNLLVGYGIAVGLNGTGDSLQDSVFTRESLLGMLERLGVNARDTNLRTDNVAAVMVTATLSPFARQGSRVDVTVSALGDATSLQGGTLLVTPLIGADGEVYAVAQGRVAIGAVSRQDALRQGRNQRGVATSGRIADGGIVEREVAFDLNARQNLKLALRQPDFTTASRIAAAINGFVGDEIARAIDPGTVDLFILSQERGGAVSLIADIEQLRVNTDQPAKVVIDEHSGVIVMGEDVAIEEVAIAHGNLTIRVSAEIEENPFGAADADAVIQQTADGNTVALLPRSVPLRKLVEGLNRLGTTPRDLIEILQTIKAAGALKADLIIL